MSQDNQFHQYGYDHYLKAPRKKSKSVESEGIVSRVMSNLQSPAVATVALLAAGAVFAGIIIMAYPSGDKSNQEIPIVRADLRPVKSVPEERGGMEVPNQDSTILAAVGQGTTGAEDVAPLENLLAPQPSEDILSKEQALEQAMADENPYGQQGAAEDAPESALKAEPVPTLIQEAKELEGQKSASADFEIKSPDASSILQKIEPAAEEALPEEAAPAAPSDSSKPTKLHAAATSPETIEFVRGVMNETETEAASSETVKEQAEVKEIAPSEEVASAAQAEEPVAAEAVEDIKPAAGAADHAITIESGSYYVQLASITDSSRAEKEYTKLQKKFSVLGSLGYRVQEANLDKGTFYRIQAGPISKASANAICKDIKAQSGGCIVAK